MGPRAAGDAYHSHTLRRTCRISQTPPSGRRRVLLIDLGAHFGGVENYLVHLAELLGAELEVSALCVLPELAHRLRSQGVRVTLLPTCRGLLKPLRFGLAALAMTGLLMTQRLDTVQVNGLLEAALILPARLLGARAVYTRHGPFELEYYSWLRQPHKMLPRKIAQLSARLASHIVCVSRAVAESVIGLAPPERISVIPNWVALPSPPHALHDAVSAPVRILCCARLEQYKGIQLLLEATREMPGVLLTIVGDGSYRAALEQLAAGRSDVRFTGFATGMDRFYRESDLFVMPSNGPEGLPMTSLEAMSYGLPCVFSDLPVHREITNDGQAAMLFPPGDVGALRTALEQLIRDNALRRTMGARAAALVSEHHSATSAREPYLRVFSPAPFSRTAERTREDEQPA